jgi:hypothetical protein
VRIYGTRDTLEVDYTARTVTLQASPRVPSMLGSLLPPFEQATAHLRAGAHNLLRFARGDFHYFAGLHHLVGRFYDAVVSGAPLPVPYRDIERVAVWTDEIVRQVEEQP